MEDGLHEPGTSILTPGKPQCGNSNRYVIKNPSHMLVVEICMELVSPIAKLLNFRHIALMQRRFSCV